MSSESVYEEGVCNDIIRIWIENKIDDILSHTKKHKLYLTCVQINELTIPQEICKKFWIITSDEEFYLERL